MIINLFENKIKTNDDSPLSKIVNIPVCVVIVSSAFKENNKCYPQVLLHDCFYEYEEDVNPMVLEYFFECTDLVNYKSSSCVKC